MVDAAVLQTRKVISRRRFLSAGLLVLGSVACRVQRSGRRAQGGTAEASPLGRGAQSASVDPGQHQRVLVAVVDFADSGQKKGRITVEKVIKTDDEWRRLLTPQQFQVARKADTEF